MVIVTTPFQRKWRCAAARPLLAGIALLMGAPLGAQTVTSSYTLLNYSPDGGNTVYATQLMGISGNTAVGFYNVGTGSEGVIYNLTNAQWSSYDMAGSTLNRTILSGINNGTMVGAFATIYPDPKQHQAPTAWLGGYGLLVGDQVLSRDGISDPNVDPTHEQEGTWLTGVSMSSPSSGSFVGYYLDANSNAHGFSNGFANGLVGDYTPIACIPTAIQGDRYIGNSTGSGGVNELYYFNGTTNAYLQAPWAVRGTYAGGISGDWIAGTWMDDQDNGHGYLYNVTNGGWYQVNDVPGSVSTSISGIDGSTIVGGWVSAPQVGGATLSGSFLGTLPVPEPSTYLLFGLGALVVGAVVRRRG